MITVNELVTKHGGSVSQIDLGFISFWEIRDKTGNCLAVVEKSIHAPDEAKAIESLSYILMEVRQNGEIKSIYNKLEKKTTRVKK